MEKLEEIRLPKNFVKYDGEEIMSNYDYLIIEETAEAIKGKELYSHYAGWNFNGQVWWENDLWHCEVWCYGSYQQTVSAETLNKIMNNACSIYGDA